MNDEVYSIRIHKGIAVVELTETVVDEKGLLDLCLGLSELFNQLGTDENIRVVVLTDAGENALCLGEEILEQAAGLPESAWQQTRMLADSIARLNQPVIAAIVGGAIGMGLELALACDIRIAASESTFGLPHIKKELLPWCGGSQRLPRIVGRAKALEMILTGEPIDARTAGDIGLVCKVVPDSELMTEAISMAETLAEKGPLSMSFVKEAVNKGMDLTMGQGLRLEADLYYLLHTTQDRTEGINAFQQRRSPKFTGK